MNVEKIKLQQVAINEDNPREITEEKLQKLIESILILPKMMELRPIVVNDGMYILGGNMRCMALNQIQQMDDAECQERIERCAGFNLKTKVEQENLIDYWKKWKAAPFAYIVKASQLTEAEQREFIIKDNVGFGQWDWDKLANEWDDFMLNDWGLDVPAFDSLNLDTTEQGENESENGYKIAYELVFNDEQEQDKWYEFLRELKNKYQDYDTISERVILVVNDWLNNNK